MHTPWAPQPLSRMQLGLRAPSPVAPCPRTNHGIHKGLAGEHVLDQPVLLVLFKLLPVGSHHACRVLPPVLQHQQPLVQLRIHGAFTLVNTNYAAHAWGGPAGGQAARHLGRQDRRKGRKGVLSKSGARDASAHYLAAGTRSTPKGGNTITMSSWIARIHPAVGQPCS